MSAFRRPDRNGESVGREIQGTVHRPAPGQQPETAFGFLKFADDQPHPLACACAAARPRCHLDRQRLPARSPPVAACTSPKNSAPCARSCSLAAVTFKASKYPNGSTATCSLEPFLRLSPSPLARSPLSGVLCLVRPFRMKAEGCGERLASSHHGACRSSAMAAKQPALMQRCACCSTGHHGGKSLGSNRYGQPARTK